jgi:hypothetical protein
MKYLILALCTALYVAARWDDIISSLKTAWYYGLEESNKLWRDADGEFNAFKNIIASAVPILIALLVDAFGNTWQGVFIYLPIAVASAIVARDNLHKAADNRQHQIAFLRGIKDGGSLAFPPLIYRNGKAFFGLFHWLYVPQTGDLNADISAASSKLFALAQKSEETWFPG